LSLYRNPNHGQEHPILPDGKQADSATDPVVLVTAVDLIAVMERLVAERGAPEHICSDNGSEFIARILQQWLAGRNVKTLLYRSGQPLAKR
jgi:hypothetical protein